ncbi:MAG: hypothetical protein M1160_02810 [Candidatus Marsarchaeota archaeon]|nr:hypothetical protein [Candidatus Marsarchaeota archaeon]MCL5111784.1 hypothetical protein [Candidatus Marsarchaeota archaeon]
MDEEQQKVEFIEPEIEEMKLKAKLTGSLEEIAKRLSSLEVFQIASDQSGVTLLRIESRDIQKRPFLFFIIGLGSDGVTLQYSIAQDTSPKMRRLYVFKNLLNVLSLVSDIYYVDNAELFQHIDSAIDDVVGSMPQSYGALYNSYDSLYNEYKALRRLNVELTASNKNLTVQAMNLSSQNRELQQKLKELQTYSDEALMARLQDWIEAHNSTIDVDEFSKATGVAPPRVEQALNMMISKGFIEVKG